jgi:hypothetical protein
MRTGSISTLRLPSSIRGAADGLFAGCPDEWCSSMWWSHPRRLLRREMVRE